MKLQLIINLVYKSVFGVGRAMRLTSMFDGILLYAISQQQENESPTFIVCVTLIFVDFAMT